MNEPFSHDPIYVETGLPGYTESYHSGNPRAEPASYGSSSMFFLLLAAGAAALAYRRTRGK